MPEKDVNSILNITTDFTDMDLPEKEVCVFYKVHICHFTWPLSGYYMYSRICVKWQISKRLIIGFQDQLLLNAGQKYCRMLQVEHSAILLTFVELPFVIKIFVLCIFECPFYTGFTVPQSLICKIF